MTERGVIEPIQRFADHRFACGFRCEKTSCWSLARSDSRMLGVVTDALGLQRRVGIQLPAALRSGQNP